MKLNDHPNLKINDPVYQAALAFVETMPGFHRLSTQETRFLTPSVRHLIDALVARGMILDNDIEVERV